MIKKLLKILIPVIIILPIVLYISVVITNNCIADRIEKELVKYELPENTVLVDSLSIAGKLTGNGNGMQYMGSILVTSNLSEEQLCEYYSSNFDYIEVRKQESESIDFINTNNYSFTKFSENDSSAYYSITCWNSNRSEIFSDFIVELLDFDMRGH